MAGEGAVDRKLSGGSSNSLVLWDAEELGWGLGDRIRGVACVLALASELGCRILLRWEPNDACDARFEDLFDCPDLVTFTRRLTVRDCGRISPTITMTENINIMPAHAFQLFSANAKTNVFRSVGHFDRCWAEQIRLLKPVPSFREAIDECVSKRFRERMVAVHLRRTDVLGDGTKPIDAENQSAFDDRMLAEIQALHRDAPDMGLFLASDDREYFRDWRNRLQDLGMHVVVHEKEWGDTFRQTSIGDALIDLYLIGHCQIILGSVWSSFLFVAQHIRGAELRYIQP